MVSDDQLQSINSSGVHCGTVLAVDDDIVESNETHTIRVYQNDLPQNTMLRVVVIDNDCKCRNFQTSIFLNFLPAC